MKVVGPNSLSVFEGQGSQIIVLPIRATPPHLGPYFRRARNILDYIHYVREYRPQIPAEPSIHPHTNTAECAQITMRQQPKANSHLKLYAHNHLYALRKVLYYAYCGPADPNADVSSLLCIACFTKLGCQ